MDKMLEVVVALAALFIVMPGLILANYQDAIDATTDSTVESVIFLLLVLGLLGLGVGVYSYAQKAFE